MNRTTQLLLAAGGIVVLSYPGISWVTGLAIESRLQQNEQRVLAQVPYLGLTGREYRRGVFRSTEIDTYSLRIPLPQALQTAGGTPLPTTATITVRSDIEHGPFPGLRTPALATVHSTLLLPSGWQKSLSGVPGSTPLVEVDATLGFLGGATARLASPAFSLRLAGGSSLTWGGLTSTLAISRNQAHWSGQLSAPHLAFDGPQGQLELSGLEYSGSQRKAFDDLYAGTGILTIEQIDGTSARSGSKYSLQRVSLTSTSRADGEFLDMRVDVGMDAASIAAMQLKDVVYSEGFEHLHGPSLAAMLQAIRGAERQAGGSRAQLQTGMQDAIRQYGIELLLHDPVIDIRQVSFTMPEGSLRLSARISAPGLSRADLQWPAAIAALREHGRVTADLRVDDGLVQKLLAMGGPNPSIAAQLTSFEQQGYLAAASGTVATHLSYAGGALTLNGHPFPPAPTR